MSKEIYTRIQRDLCDLGLYKYAVDGVWGQLTQDSWDGAVNKLRKLRDGATQEVAVEQPFMIEPGDRGEHVTKLQVELKRVGYNLSVDGHYGPGTLRAVKEYQQARGLIPDGRVGEKTLASIKNHPLPNALTQAAIEWAAKELDVDVASVMAVNEVETRGSGFFSNGLPAILFERHVMRRRLINHKIDPTPYMDKYPEIVNRSSGGYTGGVREYSRLEKAKQINEDCALESASWGCYQIMGYHWKALGYKSVKEFVMLMKLGEFEHLKAFVKFIKLDRRLHTALKDKDWLSFARGYNGPAQKGYDAKLASAYAKHQVDHYGLT